VSSAATQQAIALFLAGVNEAALETATRALATDPTDVDALLVVAGTRRRLGDVPGSMSAIESALHLAPDSAEVSNQLAFTRHVARDSRGAIEAANRTIRLEPDEIWPRVSMAGILSETRGQAREAVRAAEDALRMDADNVPALGILGQSHLLLRHRTQAQAAFRAALALDPEDWVARHGLARLENLVDGDPVESIRRFSRLLPERPDDATIPVNLRVAILRLLRRLSWVVLFAPVGAGIVLGVCTRTVASPDPTSSTFRLPTITPFPSFTIGPFPTVDVPTIGPAGMTRVADAAPAGGIDLAAYLPAAVIYGLVVWAVVALLVMVTLLRLRPFTRRTVRFAWREAPLRWLALAIAAVALPLPVPFAFPMTLILALLLIVARWTATGEVIRRNQPVVG
jgi:Flp pilus assembly protein TadD